MKRWFLKILPVTKIITKSDWISYTLALTMISVTISTLTGNVMCILDYHFDSNQNCFVLLEFDGLILFLTHTHTFKTHSNTFESLCFSFLCATSKRTITCYSCWMSTTVYENILVVPVCISMFLNLLFLCNIVRVVLLKLKAPAGIQGSCGPSRTVLQAFR